VSETALHLTLRVGDEAYALPVEHVVEVGEFDAPTPVPGGPRELLGVRNLRGEVLPVFDFATVLGLATGLGPRRLVVAADHGRRAGLAVTAVHDVRELPDADEKADSPFLAGAALTDEGLVGVVDVERLFDELAARSG
jgi:purine-binding chemotaxis protein CheW